MTLSLGLGLGLSRRRGGGGGGVAWATLPPPAGFVLTPSFGVQRSSAGGYRHDFDPAAVKPVPTLTYYVGKGGSNAAAGTSWATRVRSLQKALALVAAAGSSAVVRLVVEAAVYRYSEGDGSFVDGFGGTYCEGSLIIEPCDSSGSVLTDRTAKIVSLHDQAMPAWSLVSGSVYVSTYTTEVPSPGMLDMSILNGHGRPQALRYAPGSYANEAAIVTGINAMAVAWGHGACYINTTAKKVYVRLSNDRAPDADLVVCRGGFTSNQSAARNLYLAGKYGGTQQVWCRNLHVWGGAGLYAAAQWSSEARTIQSWWSDCSFCYAGTNGVSADGAGNHIFLRCHASDNYKDGYNYDQASGFDANADAVMTFAELDCRADWNGGSSTSDDSDNATSAHVRAKGVRVNCTYSRTLNRAVHDILAAQTWNLGCIASDCRQTGVQSGAFVAGFSPNTGETTKVWLDGCQSINNAYDLEAYKGGQLYYANMVTTGYVNETSGTSTISAYNSPPQVPGATGTLAATALSSSTVQLAFTAASGATGYKYRINGAGSWLTLAGDKIVTGLTQTTTYSFEVRGTNVDGDGPVSNSASVTTPASPTPVNLLLNSDFSAGTANWGGFGWSGKSVSGGKAVFASTPAFDGITQTVALQAGKYYELRYTISTRTAGTIYGYISGANGTDRTATGTFVERLLAASPANAFGIQSKDVATLSFDDVELWGPYDTATPGGA